MDCKKLLSRTSDNTWLKIIEKGLSSKYKFTKTEFAPENIKFICEGINDLIDENKTLNLIIDDAAKEIDKLNKEIDINDKMRLYGLRNKKVDIRKTYLMKDNNTGLYKIGYSKNPKHRESTLQSEKPSIKMVKIWDYNIEKKLHNLYKDFRIRGEYFNLNKIQVKYICTHF